MPNDDSATPWEDMGYGADPDLERERQLRARPRTPEHSDKAVTERIGAWRPPTYVTMARCQAHPAGCTNLVGVTAEGMGALETFSRILQARGEAPLSLDECFPCDRCLGLRQEAAIASSAKRRVRTRDAIRVLTGRTASTPQEEREAELYLERTLGAGHLTDLKRWTEERNRKPRKGADL